MHVHGRQPTEAWLFERESRSPPREHRHWV